MRTLLVLGVLALVGAEEVPTPGPTDHRLAVFARGGVQIELFAPMGGAQARAVLVNRLDHAVQVEYTVDERLGEPRTYHVDLQGRETRGADGRYVIPIGGQPRPRTVITRVDRVPVEEASGYVRLAEDRRDRVTITLYRPQSGGDRVFVVLVNADDRAVTVHWEASGLVGGAPLTFATELAAHAVRGRDGRVSLPYRPIDDPRMRVRPRVRIDRVVPAAR